MPGTAIPALSPAELIAVESDVVLLFVSTLMADIRRALPEIDPAGGRCVNLGSGRPASGDQSWAAERSRRRQ
jgi:hypothetical protein